MSTAQIDQVSVAQDFTTLCNDIWKQPVQPIIVDKTTITDITRRTMNFFTDSDIYNSTLWHYKKSLVSTAVAVGTLANASDSDIAVTDNAIHQNALSLVDRSPTQRSKYASSVSCHTPVLCETKNTLQVEVIFPIHSKAFSLYAKGATWFGCSQYTTLKWDKNTVMSIDFIRGKPVNYIEEQYGKYYPTYELSGVDSHSFFRPPSMEYTCLNKDFDLNIELAHPLNGTDKLPEKVPSADSRYIKILRVLSLTK